MRTIFRPLLLVLLITSCPVAEAQGTDHWLVQTVGSYHKDRLTPYNERNDGLGYERSDVINSNWSQSVGFYKNSFKRTSVYAAVGYKPIKFLGVRAGVQAMCVTGYTEKVSCAPLPEVSFEYKGYGVNLQVTPVVLGFQIKRRF